jgi:hypothetical protein
LISEIHQELALYIGLFWKSHQSRCRHLHMHFASRWFFMPVKLDETLAVEKQSR